MESSHLPSHAARPARSGVRKLGVVLGVIGLCVACAIGGMIFWRQWGAAWYENYTGEQEVDRLVSQVGKIMVLPDEVPTVATVQDKTKLTGQAFFNNSENGDKVLIFPESKRVILYRPSQRKVIEVSTITIDQPTNGGTTSTPTPTPVASASPALPTVTLLNASSIAGITRSFESDLKVAADVEVTTRANAATTQPSSLVVDLSGQNGRLAQTLATELNLEVATLPPGEARPSTDLVIILGQDRAPQVTPSPSPSPTL